MSVSPPAPSALDREFLGIRSRLIDLAASLDRIERSASPSLDDPRRAQFRRALEILLSEGTDRAEQVQLAFSLPCDEKR
jgi:hypothetical protein